MLVVGWNSEVQHMKITMRLPVTFGIHLFKICYWVKRLELALDNNILAPFLW